MGATQTPPETGVATHLPGNHVRDAPATTTGPCQGPPNVKGRPRETRDRPFGKTRRYSACFGSPWQRLYFLPDPHGHGALRSTLP